MLIGAHISASGGVQNAPENAHQAGCEVFQFFSRSPRGGNALELTPQIIKRFKDDCKKYNLKESYIHAPYYINLASLKNNIYYGSISVLREELERGNQLGVKYIMTHLGSAKDLTHKNLLSSNDRKDALNRVSAGIQKILHNYNGSTQFLIEMSSGAGMIIGDSFEEIKEILRLTHHLNDGLTSVVTIGICYDTAHAFESGYDIRTREAVKKTFDQFDKILGLEKLKLIHANDSKTDLGSHVDRHEHIGFGKIGLDGFKALINEPRLRNINLILETPADGIWINDIKTLKKLRN